MAETKYECIVRWNAGEEDGVHLVIRGDTYADVKAEAQDFLAVIRTERQLYNDLVQKPLFEKNEELETALVEKQRALAAIDEKLLTAGLHP
jgi:hypothetical protein